MASAGSTTVNFLSVDHRLVSEYRSLSSVNSMFTDPSPVMTTIGLLVTMLVPSLLRSMVAGQNCGPWWRSAPMARNMSSAISRYGICAAPES